MRVFKGFLILAILSLVTYYGFFTENMTYADWVIDQNPPTVTEPVVTNNVGISKTCFTIPDDFPLTAKSRIDDQNPTSGITGCKAKLNNGDPYAGSITNISNNTPPFTPNSPSTADCTASIPVCNNPDNQNTIIVTAEDGVGNVSSPASSDFYCSANCNPGPWIKTTGGDVHTNESINIPQ